MRTGPWQDAPAPAVEQVSFGMASWYVSATGWPWASTARSVTSSPAGAESDVPLAANAVVTAERTTLGAVVNSALVLGRYLWGWTPAAWAPEMPEDATAVEYEGDVVLGPVTVSGGVVATAYHLASAGRPADVTQEATGQVVAASGVTRSGQTVSVPALSPSVIHGWAPLAGMTVPTQAREPVGTSPTLPGDLTPVTFTSTQSGDLSLAVIVDLAASTTPPTAPLADGGWAHTLGYLGGAVDLAARALVTRPRYRFIYPGGGAWRLRQRQTLTGTDGWPLRQRQNGGHSGSWPLRQRQRGV